MKVYHGSSSRSITKFDLRHSLRTNLDFGKGIYFTTNIEQAIAWSCRNKSVGAVYECEIDITGFSVLNLDKKDEDLLYVLYLCRIGLEDYADTVDGFENADIVMGLMLDGKVKKFEDLAERFNTGDVPYDKFYEQVELYSNGYDQICIKSKDALQQINTSIKKVYYTQKTMGNIQIVKTVNIGDENDEI